MRPAVHHRQRVFGHLAVEQSLLLPPGGLDGILRADADAAAAADALRMVDLRLAFGKRRSAVSADAGAGPAADAERPVHGRLAVAVLLHLAGARTATHADVLDGPAEAGHLMPLEVGQRNEDVGVHDRASDLRFAHQFAVGHRNCDVVSPFQPVADDHVAAGRIRSEAVEVGGLDVFERMFARTDVEGVAVGQERPAAKLFDLVGDGAGEVRAQEREVAGFAEVDFDRGEAVLEVDRVHSGPFQQQSQLLLEVPPAGLDSHIGKINVRFFHDGIFLQVS